MTDESPELVAKWVARAKPSYPVAILKNAEQFEDFLNVKGFPTCAVIDPQGLVAYAGFSGMEEGPLGDALDQAKKAPLWPKSLAKVTKLMQSADASKAYGELKKLVDGGKLTEQDQPFVNRFLAYLEGGAQDDLTEARALHERGHLLKAVKKLELFANAQPPFPSSKEGAELLKEIQGAPDFKKEAAGGEEFAQGETLEDEGEFLEAFEVYKGIAKKFSGTKIAENARKRAEELRSEGKPGFESSCNGCRKAGRACDKHKKDVKL